MPQVVEGIPNAFAAEAEAARAWFSKQHGTDFKLTGIVDPDDIDERDSATTARELQLILCGNQNGQEMCLRERFELTPAGDGFDVIHLKETSSEPGSPAPLLDPPAGIRKGWLDKAVDDHAFVVLVFYRGFW